jgi:hypothetical protein
MYDLGSNPTDIRDLTYALTFLRDDAAGLLQVLNTLQAAPAPARAVHEFIRTTYGTLTNNVFWLLAFLPTDMSDVLAAPDASATESHLAV